MKMTMLEKSECFRGFLLLIAQDRKVSLEEKDLLRRIGKVLDFEGHFCEEAMNDLLDNEFISRDPPRFSRREYAEAFLLDCIRIAGSDREIHPKERVWLLHIAEANGLTPSWVDQAVKHRQPDETNAPEERMEIETYL
jgi:hypothetical protein